jgi:hypothetical protein
MSAYLDEAEEGIDDVTEMHPHTAAMPVVTV